MVIFDNFVTPILETNLWIVGIHVYLLIGSKCNHMNHVIVIHCYIYFAFSCIHYFFNFFVSCLMSDTPSPVFTLIYKFFTTCMVTSLWYLSCKKLCSCLLSGFSFTLCLLSQGLSVCISGYRKIAKLHLLHYFALDESL